MTPRPQTRSRPSRIFSVHGYVIGGGRTLGGPVRVVFVIAMGRGTNAMSKIRNGILVALAISATFGAVQFASGHDLAGRWHFAATAADTGVNRAAKADRDAVKAEPAATRTIALRLNGLADTSVVLRVPVVKDEARSRPLAPAKPAASKATIACEPPVSVLTDVAKLLQPGRCIT
jgi:hypothetical protein